MGGHMADNEFEDGKSRLYVSEFVCAGRAQLWLSRKVDKSGKELPYDHEYRYGEEAAFVVEEILMLPVLKKNEDLISIICSRNGVELGPSSPFAFAIGTKADIYQGSKEPVGYTASHFAQAWKVNVTKRRFEPIPTKGLACEFIE
jgi:hypothetical protein